MKRNEAKMELFYILERLNSHPEANTSIAEEMLFKLEQLGMQPPAIKEPCETFVLYNGKYVKTEDSFVFTSRWEDEA